MPGLVRLVPGIHVLGACSNKNVGWPGHLRERAHDALRAFWPAMTMEITTPIDAKCDGTADAAV
jgi:hypothetical protein